MAHNSSDTSEIELLRFKNNILKEKIKHLENIIEHLSIAAINKDEKYQQSFYNGMTGNVLKYVDDVFKKEYEALDLIKTIESY